MNDAMGRFMLAEAFSSGSPNWVNTDLGPSINGANLAGFVHTHQGESGLLSGNDSMLGRDMLDRTQSPVVYVGAIGSVGQSVIWNTKTQAQDYIP